MVLVAEIERQLRATPRRRDRRGEATDEGKPAVEVGDLVPGFAGEFGKFVTGARVADDGTEAAFPWVDADR